MLLKIIIYNAGGFIFGWAMGQILPAPFSLIAAALGGAGIGYCGFKWANS